MANKKFGMNLKPFYIFLVFSILMAVVVVAANKRVTYQSNAALNVPSKISKTITRTTPRPTGVTIRPTSTPTMTPTPIAFPILTFYLKTSDNINASPNIASSVIVGCNAGDTAISGGMESYGGPLNKWKTVRSTPSNSTDMNGYLVTMLNEDTVAHTFTVTVKCLKKQ